MKLTRCTFTNSQLHEVDLAEADLSKVVLTKCDLLNANFDHTMLAGADLRDSLHYSIDPEINTVKGARFSMPAAVGLLDKFQVKIDLD